MPLLVAQVFSAQASTSALQVAAALLWLVEAGVTLVNLSLGLQQDRSQLLATNGVSGDVSVIDAKNLKVLKSVKVGRYPWGVVVTP